ncbi:MAG: class I SAM-dependent methyltransferase [Ignavibacteria bacterium]|nr:class I SAM-dependent methyltransferase [Ignavibacteria bacterium]
MDQTTSMDRSSVQGAKDFYDAIAPSYDELTSFGKRFVQERPFFRLLVERFQIGTALDAGAGTGFHSLLLAQLGVKVTALDHSPQMLRHLKRHASEMGLRVDTVESSFHTIRDHVKKSFDAVLCLGNTLPHLLGAEELRKAIESFSSVLNPKGVLLIQLLNYERILASRERVQNVREVEGKTFVRFYDYGESLLTFNILTIYKSEGEWHHSLQSTPLRPVVADELKSVLASLGYEDPKTYGSISLEPFDRQASRDLVIVARK